MRLPILLLLAPAFAQAHQGHGAFGQHLHPGEALGVLALAALAALVLARLWRK